MDAVYSLYLILQLKLSMKLLNQLKRSFNINLNQPPIPTGITGVNEDMTLDPAKFLLVW